MEKKGMLSTKITRIIPMLLIFVSAAFAVAPGWVAKGVVLDYSMDGDTVTFTVTGRTSTEVQMEIETVETHTATENATLTYGQFWFDDSLLEGASKGDDIGEFEVTAVGAQTFAGKQWDTVTMEATISGAKTVRIYDIDSGLMLKQTVDATGAPAVTLTKYTVPDFEAVAPQPPQPTGPTEPTEPSQPEPEEVTEEPPVTTTEEPMVGEAQEEPAPQEEEKKPCLAGAVLLMLAGFVFVRS